MNHVFKPVPNEDILISFLRQSMSRIILNVTRLSNNHTADFQYFQFP